ncbi:MAG: hypothetical protein ACLQU1_24250 [Bryobacteraceae bacterium]
MPIQPKIDVPSPKRSMDFEEFTAYGPLTFPVPFGTLYSSVLSVKNNHKSPRDVIYNVRCSISYSLEGVHQFTVNPVIWFVESTGGYGRTDVLDLGWNEFQRFPIFLTRHEDQVSRSAFPQASVPLTAMWYNSSGNEIARTLGIGLWTAKIRITADNHDPICAQIDFTVHPQPGTKLLAVRSAPDVTRLRIDCSEKDAPRHAP